MKLLALLLGLCLGLPAQAAPQGPYGPPLPPVPASVGMVLRHQMLNQGVIDPVPVDNTQILGVFTHPFSVATTQPVGVGPEVIGNHYLWLFSAYTELDLASGQVQMGDETSFHFFSLSLLSNNSWPLPFGAALQNTVFSDPVILVPAFKSLETFADPTQWSSTHDTSSMAVNYPWRAHFLPVKAYGSFHLVGLPFSVQSFRIQDTWNLATGVWGPQLFASDEVIFAIN